MAETLWRYCVIMVSMYMQFVASDLIWFDNMNTRSNWIEYVPPSGQIYTSTSSSYCSIPNCVVVRGAQAYISRTTDVSSYKNIAIQYDLITHNIGTGDYCTIDYNIGASWINSTYQTGKTLTLTTIIYNFSSSIDNSDSLMIRLRTDGITGDTCYYDEIYLYGTPSTSVTTTSMPTTFAPITSIPTTSQPITSIPTTSQPITYQPITSQPSTYNPITITPTTAMPTTNNPTTSTPTTESPTTSAPLTQSPSTQNPITFIPTTQNPTTSNPTTLTSIIQSSTTQTTTIQNSVTVTNIPTKSTNDGAAVESTITQLQSVDNTNANQLQNNNDSDELVIHIIVVVVSSITLINCMIFILCLYKKQRNKKRAKTDGDIAMDRVKSVSIAEINLSDTSTPQIVTNGISTDIEGELFDNKLNTKDVDMNVVENDGLDIDGFNDDNCDDMYTNIKTDDGTTKGANDDSDNGFIHDSDSDDDDSDLNVYNKPVHKTTKGDDL